MILLSMDFEEEDGYEYELPLVMPSYRQYDRRHSHHIMSTRKMCIKTRAQHIIAKV